MITKSSKKITFPFCLGMENDSFSSSQKTVVYVGVRWEAKVAWHEGEGEMYK